jgi:FkbH-like protein
MVIGLCGNIFLDPLASELDKINSGNEIIVGIQDAFLEELKSPDGFTDLDICIIAIDWEKSVPDLYGFVYGNDFDQVVSSFQNACNEIKDAIIRYRFNRKSKFLIFSPISQVYGSSGFINRLLLPSPFELFSRCQLIFNDMCRSLTEVYPVDMEELSSCIGKDLSFSAENRYKFSQPFSDLMIKIIVDHICHIIAQIFNYPLKCLVLDLDNTLWGGIIGEAGIENVELSDTGTGKAYKDFQNAVYKLYRQGVILAVCSKNNTCDALEMMEQHPHMIIRPNMISSFRINWDNKPANIAGISEELNISLDSMMFIDDDPSERHMVREMLPEVVVLDLPENPAYYCDALKKCHRFWPLQLTIDDTQKGNYYKQESLRKSMLKMSDNKEQYLVNSKILIKIRPPDESVLPRIVQLINKTNQFNLTTNRYGQDELQTMMKDSKNRLFYMHMADKYGEYGIIGSAIIKDNLIDSFLLSCRAFGREAERALLIYLMNHIKDSGYESIQGLYVPSKKNSMVKNFYNTAGFSLKSESISGQLWQFDFKDAIPEPPRWLGHAH